MDGANNTGFMHKPTFPDPKSGPSTAKPIEASEREVFSEPGTRARGHNLPWNENPKSLRSTRCRRNPFRSHPADLQLKRPLRFDSRRRYEIQG